VPFLPQPVLASRWLCDKTIDVPRSFLDRRFCIRRFEKEFDMGAMTKALVASVLMLQAASASAQCATCDAEAAARAARNNLAGGIVVGSIVLATAIVAITGGNDGLDTVVAPPVVVPPATTTTSTSTSTSTRTR
jgi:hypothetical protein